MTPKLKTPKLKTPKLKKISGKLYTLYKSVPKSIPNPDDKAFAIMDSLRKQTFKSVRQESTKTHILIWKEK